MLILGIYVIIMIKKTVGAVGKKRVSKILSKPLSNLINSYRLEKLNVS